jgi:hypothetical protein
MSYRNPVIFLNALLADLGQEQDADQGDWAYDKVEPQAWFTANHPDGRFVEVWVEHVSDDACGTTALSLEKKGVIIR